MSVRCRAAPDAAAITLVSASATATATATRIRGHRQHPRLRQWAASGTERDETGGWIEWDGWTPPHALYHFFLSFWQLAIIGPYYYPPTNTCHVAICCVTTWQLSSLTTSMKVFLVSFPMVSHLQF